MEELKRWVAQKKEQYGDELAQAESREEKWAYAEVLAILDEVSYFLEED